VRSSDEETKARIQGSRGNEPAESSSYPHRSRNKQEMILRSVFRILRKTASIRFNRRKKNYKEESHKL